MGPNSTDKDTDFDLIGEKGVGLTYAIFSCNRFILRTQTATSYFEGQVENAALWKNAKISEKPQLICLQEKALQDETNTFTDITLEDVESHDTEGDTIFDHPVGIIEWILRTKTVIGYLKTIFHENATPFEVTLIYIGKDGQKHSYEIPASYMLPSTFIHKQDYIDLDEFKERAAVYDDRQKKMKLQGKALYKVGSVLKGNRTINYYCFYAPSRNFWKEICERTNLFAVDPSGEKNNLYQGGIYIATKGMPTGITIDPPLSGSSGYWPNFYMIFEDDYIVFDLGRKTIPGRAKGIFREEAKKLFSEFLPFIQYVSTDPSVKSNTNSTIQQYEKSKTYADLLLMAPLRCPQIPYCKNPSKQEAALVSIFHELLGAGILKGYLPLKTGFKETYDLWCTYRISKQDLGAKFHPLTENGYLECPCVIEFKYSGEAILDDFTEDIKYFPNIDLLVCWDFDENKFARNRVEVEPLGADEVMFYGSNYKLTWPGSYNLGSASEKPMLVLRKFLEDMNE